MTSYAYLQMILLLGAIAMPYMSNSNVLMFPDIMSAMDVNMSELFVLAMREEHTPAWLKHPNTAGILKRKTEILSRNSD